ncbi:MAG: hypothetical protein L6W00_29900 [Lentisphaeria bacterium]|nr:MAG: hypothetical protein L6W00_29900 [Lentisphaeria bacterium]
MITPIGNDLAANEVALRAGKCGVGRVPDFVEHKLSCEVGGLVQGPLETELIDRKKLRFCPPVGVMSVIAAQEAFAEAGCRWRSCANGASPSSAEWPEATTSRCSTRRINISAPITASAT